MQIKYTWPNWLLKNIIHILVFLLLAVYLASANIIYTTFFLKNGKPLKVSPEIPSITVDMLFHITDFDQRLYEGQEIYELRGYVFAPDIPGSAEHKKIFAFHSTNEDKFFAAEAQLRQGLTEKLPQYHMDVDLAGFRLLIAKEALEQGNYRIGCLLESHDGSSRVFQWFDTYIEREPNALRLIGDTEHIPD